MTIEIEEGDFSPPAGTHLETRSCGAATSKPKYNDFSGKKIQGISTPGYHQLVKKGAFIQTTPWYKFNVSGSYSGSRTYAYYTNNVLTCSYNQTDAHTNHFMTHGSVTGIVNYTENEIINLIDEDQIDYVVTRALVKLAASKHDSLTFLAELRKVISMFRNLGSNIASFLRNHNARELANMWLQGRYGWRTLVFDLQSIQEALNHLESESAFWKESLGFSSSSSTDSYGTRDMIDGNYGGLSVTETIEISYRGIARGSVKPPSFGGDLAITAWEIVPFSFVIDWFINIGQKIALLSLDMDPDVSSHYGVHVTAKATSVSSLASGASPATGYRFTKNEALATVTATYVDRKLYTPSVLPSFRINLDEFKVADIIALIIQLFSKHK